MKMNFLKNYNIRILLSTFLLGGLLAGCQKEVEMQCFVEGEEEIVYSYSANPIPDRYIVLMKETSVNKYLPVQNATYEQSLSAVENAGFALLQDNGIPSAQLDQDIVFGVAVKGFVATLNQEQVNLLRNDTRIDLIEQDQMISLGGGKPGGGTVAQPDQTTPWGITRVGGYTAVSDATAWIIDSGVQLNHPDLKVDATRSISMLSRWDGKGWSSPADYYGHGTHVAGTVAAINNTIGVVGVAAGATIVSVRVLNSQGSGAISGVIRGVDYVAANGASGDVANMSLGGPVSQALDDAVANLGSKGVYVVVAAGNSTADANNYSPSRVNGTNIYTVSAMDNLDAFASFSNYGTPVDYCQPGVNVRSTYLNSGYATGSGTSMAAPHLAGLLLATSGTLNIDGYVSNDPDGSADPIAHK